MHAIRTARRARGLTITQLALMSGVPARALGAAEYGSDPLHPQALLSVAIALQMAPSQLGYAPPRTAPPPAPLPWRPAAAALLTAAAIAAAWSVGLPAAPPPLTASGAAARIRPGAQAAPAPTLAPLPTLAPASAPLPTPAPTSLPGLLIAAAAAPDGMPQGCPLLAAPERVLVTQGYGTGTHAPATLAGAIDLAIDADGDGYAEPAATDGQVVLATHSGVARVWLDSWPGGNVIRVIDEASGWSTLYAHLSTAAVADGERVALGQPIGRVGTTGMSSGPHLHYEIWHLAENRDPTGAAPCWRPE